MILETDVDLLIDSESVLSLSGDSVLGVSSSTFDISAVDSLSINTDNIFVNSSSGFVGIGTITPSVKLDIVSLLNDTVPFFALENTGGRNTVKVYYPKGVSERRKDISNFSDNMNIYKVT